jgi:hypothetical protein
MILFLGFWENAAVVFERQISSDFVSEITVRRDHRGGELRRDAKVKGHINSAGEIHLVVLIHGFSVDEEAARTAYAQFRKNLPQENKMQLTQFFWPGDAHVSGLMSKVLYPWMPDRAENAALRLVTYLAGPLSSQAQGTVNLYIVAHSLGCRLTLETLRILSTHGDKFRIKLVALMAAAVPIHAIKPNGRYALIDLASDRVQVHYSRRDLVLGAIFKAGQLFHSTNPTNRLKGRGALGFAGLPREYDHMPHIVDNRTQLGHGGYWSDPDVAEKVAEDLPSRARHVRARAAVRGRKVSVSFTSPRQIN